MNNETMTPEELEDLFILQMNMDVIGLLAHSAHLGSILINPKIPLDKFRSEHFYQDASFLHALAKESGDLLPFSTLVIYIGAFIEILDKRLKE